jgi:hypothetical protein
MQFAAVSFGQFAASARVQPWLHAAELLPLPFVLPDELPELQPAIDRSTKQAPAVSENLRSAVIVGPFLSLRVAVMWGESTSNRRRPGDFVR